MNRRNISIAVVLDVVSIVLFVVIGRNNHDEDGAFVTATATVAAPFLIALAAGWLGSRAWRSPFAIVPTGIVLWLTTVIVGMLLRRFVFDDGAATTFIIVASIFIGVVLVGWRALARVRACW